MRFQVQIQEPVEELFNNIEKMNKTGMSPRNELLKVQVKLNGQSFHEKKRKCNQTVENGFMSYNGNSSE